MRLALSLILVLLNAAVLQAAFPLVLLKAAPYLLDFISSKSGGGGGDGGGGGGGGIPGLGGGGRLQGAQAVMGMINSNIQENEAKVDSLMHSAGRTPEKLITAQAMKEFASEIASPHEKAGSRSISVQPGQGFNGFTNYQPSGWKITESVTDNSDAYSQRSEEKVAAYSYPYGVGPVLMNGCMSSHYSPHSPCAASRQSVEGQENCPNLMEATAYIGVGFDGRGYYKIESRRASLIQRVCERFASFMGQDVPDTMKVFGIFETTAETKSFQSASEYMDYIREKSGLSNQRNLFSMEASQFSASGGVSKSWITPSVGVAAGGGQSSTNKNGQSTTEFKQTEKSRQTKTATNSFFACMYINVILYEISLDDVKSKDINFAALKDYLSLPASIYSIGADVKYQNFLIRWGTHFIRSAKFGGQLKITKTSKTDKTMSKDEFASIAENEFQAMFSSLNSKNFQSSGGFSMFGLSAKTKAVYQSSSGRSESSSTSAMSQTNTGKQNLEQSEFTQTLVEAQGGTPQIAEALVDFYTPAFRQLYHDWISSIKTHIKPFEFQLRSIDNFFDLNMDDLFPTSSPSGLQFGCMGSSKTPVDIQTDPVSKLRYYIDSEVVTDGNETSVRHKKVFCKYKTIEDFKSNFDRRRKSLEKAVAVYMAEGPFPTSSYEVEAGQPGCEEKTAAEFKLLGKRSTPLTLAELKKAPFLISFDLPEEVPNMLAAQAKYVMLFKDDYWFATEPSNPLIHLYDGCKLMDNSANKVCIHSLVLTYSQHSGFFHIEPDDFSMAKMQLPSLPAWLSGQIVARASRLQDTHQGSLAGRPAVPCSVKWLNSHRLDPERATNCIHFTAATEGDLFVIFSAIPKDHTTWYYIEINSDGVAFYHAMKQEKRDIQKGMGILGDKTLYQSLFVCLVQQDRSVMLQYGKADADSDVGTVYSSYKFRAENKYSRLAFYTFGAGSKAASLMDIRISRDMPKVTCLNSNYVIKDKHCVLDCHKECIDCSIAHDDTACHQCRNLRLEYPASAGTRTGVHCVLECPAGYELSDSKERLCVKCGVGHFKSAPGNQKCSPCAGGTFASSTGSKICTECPQGTFVAQQGAALCDNCAPGSFSKETGSLKCTKCGAGTFADDAGQSECTPCPKGQFTNSTGQLNCSLCSGGFYSPTEGQKGCLSCPVGTSSVEGSMSCTNSCPKGKFSPAHGIPCAECPPGAVATSAGSIACVKCGNGFYQSDIGQSECLPAPAGFYAAGPGAKKLSMCPEGSANPLTKQSSPEACVECSAGHFSKAGGLANCTPCARGHYQPSAGQTSCLIADKGSFAHEEGLAESIPCPLGHYSDVKGTAECKKCAAGHYEDQTGSVSCKKCAAGHYEDTTGSLSCKKCAKGHYQALEGQNTCKPAPAGNYVPDEGAAEYTACNVSQHYAPQAAESCDMCPVDQCSEPGASECVACGKIQFAVCHAFWIEALSRTTLCTHRERNSAAPVFYTTFASTAHVRTVKISNRFSTANCAIHIYLIKSGSYDQSNRNNLHLCATESQCFRDKTFDCSSEEMSSGIAIEGYSEKDRLTEVQVTGLSKP